MISNKYKRIKLTKRVISFALCICLCIAMAGCTDTEQQEAKSAISDAVDSPEVARIKAMTLEDSGIKLGDLFDAGLGSPTYELYDPAEDGKRYVTIKGNIEYAGKPVVATLQYKDVGNDKYEVNALEYNGVPQNKLEIAAFFEFLNEEYNKLHKVSNEKTQSSTSTEKKASSNAESISYSNSKYEYGISYPASWGALKESDSGDGGVIYSDNGEQILVYGSYMMESSFEEYLAANFDGWSFEECTVSGANQAVRAEFQGEESYQTAIIAEKGGKICTLMHISMFVDSSYSDKMREEVKKGYDIAEASFKVF